MVQFFVIPTADHLSAFRSTILIITMVNYMYEWPGLPLLVHYMNTHDLDLYFMVWYERSGLLHICVLRMHRNLYVLYMYFVVG